MATEKPRKNDILTPLREGEFWRINGIAEATEKRLNDAGICTFRQLASLTPAEIAYALEGLVGVKERAARLDWPGQARKLSETLENDPPPALTEDPAERLEVEPFIVKLYLDDDHSVRWTRISQVRDGSTSGWAGWDPDRLSGWMCEQAGLRFDEVPVLPPAAPADQDQSKQCQEITGALSLMDMVLSLPGNEGSSRFFINNQPLELHLTVDLSKAVIHPGADTLGYQATVEASRFGAEEQVVVGRAQGTTSAAPQIGLRIPLQSMKEGTYRLALSVLIYPVDSLRPQQDGILAFQEGGLVHIFDRQSVLS